MLIDNAPIVAIATATGKGGIGVIRLSAKDLKPFIQALLQCDLKPRHAHFMSFLDKDHSVIDEGIALYFQNPHSYTGEDVLELQCHGGMAVMQRLLKRCLEVGQEWGLRLAHPGEFTQRAFLNNRLDLAQAEAVADLIDASSESAAKAAALSLTGVFSQRIQELAQKIVHLRMLVEATLDFPEEDIEFIQSYKAIEQLDDIATALTAILQTTEQGALIRNGLNVVLVGEPNVGKSSLLNNLAGDDIAIVTPIAGTTRDKVTQTIHLKGIPLHIIDTAGLRETADEVEYIGIERTWKAVRQAHVVLYLQEIGQNNPLLQQQLLDALPPHTPILKIFNKIDLNKGSIPRDEHAYYISALTGEGVDKLCEALLHIAGFQSQQENTWLARERHIQALKMAKQHLELAYETANQHSLDLFAEELHLAHKSLCTITGEFTTDDLLGQIFSSFCIGK